MHNEVNNLDFSNQSIYVGIDVHLKQWKVTILGQYCSFKTFSQPADSEVLVKHLFSNFPKASIHCAYEAGFSGFGLFYELVAQGIGCIVVNPADIPTKDYEKRQKTDALDSKKIANCLRSGSLESIYVPSWETIGIRNLVRTRNCFIKKRTAVKNKIKHFLYFNNINIPIEYSGSKWGKDFIAWLQQIEFQTEPSTFCLEMYIDLLTNLEIQIKKCAEKINHLAKQECIIKKLSLLKSIPGIGTLASLTLLAEIDEIKRFKTLDKLSSYVGLVPQMNSSGESERIGGLTIRGNKKLKSILIESSWTAIRKDPAMLLAFNTLCGRMQKNKAIIRIAKKLLSRIRYVLLTNQPYNMAIN